ncbi:hypothetical protein SAMN05518671_3457 [Stenotrophomonas lactitubi]|nr:hypothetical protein SAMN04487863_0456 [Stenotrophomonas sp. yr243]SNT56873.1 hypothetical protein SAMN05518671_3457 [Stenotrophomonas lactitubi]
MCAIAEARMMLMKLQLASMAALMLIVGSMATMGDAHADPSGGDICVPVKMGPHYHQRCETHGVDENGNPYTWVYWIDQNGQWYLPAD